MTFGTLCFRDDKANGFIHKTGKARFMDGMRAMERALWHNDKNGTDYVILNREAYIFKKYPRCDVEYEEGTMIVYGHI